MPSRAAVPCRVVLLLAAALCLGSAILLNEFTLAWLDFRTSPPPGTERAIRIRQLWLLGAAMLLAGVAWRVRFVVPGAWARIALVCVALLGPLATLEFGLRPVSALHRKPTTIFVRDDVLGWRLRPGVEDDWAGVRIQVNAKGLRGPEVPYARTPGALRILYLGDSVTFGFRLRDAREAYPYVVARHLEAAGSRRVETLNSGVGGWSPWQQLRWLQDEGLRYSPDLVVVGFVLNDVGEKLGLRRFGGPGIGLQLAMSRHSTLDSLADRSALVQVATGLGARLRYGSDLRRGAAEVEALRVESLVREADAPVVEAAWALTLESLDGIFDLCAENGIPVLLVAFPFAFQLDDPSALSAPQQRLASHARQRRIAFLDLLPVLTHGDFQRDGNHLSVAGGESVGRFVARAILADTALARSQGASTRR